MKFQSILRKSPDTTFRQALFSGLAPDGSLYVPENIPAFSSDFIEHLLESSLHEIGCEIANLFIDEIPPIEIEKIIHRAFSFPIPLVHLEENIFLLELFHGPTLAFKDVGARFMAETLSFFWQQEKQSLSIIVATSGDTGSAVANGFLNAPNINVFVLYPSKKISIMQEQQMTTLGKNIFAIEVQGTFDDCQRIVKQTLNDEQILARKKITTANSINLGRLIPQIAYYVWGYAQMRKYFFEYIAEPVFAIPSGNFGNLTAGVYAKKMGTPIHHFVAATNANDVVLNFFSTGKFIPATSVQTISNAMDVGNPSNFSRLQTLFSNDIKKMKEEISCDAVSDAETLQEIYITYHNTKYILDPHTAVGVVAAKKYSKQCAQKNPVIVTATAHPGKFPEAIEKILQKKITLPPQLSEAMQKTKQSIVIPPDYNTWKELFLSM